MAVEDALASAEDGVPFWGRIELADEDEDEDEDEEGLRIEVARLVLATEAADADADTLGQKVLLNDCIAKECVSGRSGFIAVPILTLEICDRTCRACQARRHGRLDLSSI